MLTGLMGGLRIAVLFLVSPDTGRGFQSFLHSRAVLAGCPHEALGYRHPQRQRAK